MVSFALFRFAKFVFFVPFEIAFLVYAPTIFENFPLDSSQSCRQNGVRLFAQVERAI